MRSVGLLRFFSAIRNIEDCQIYGYYSPVDHVDVEMALEKTDKEEGQ